MFSAVHAGAFADPLPRAQIVAAAEAGFAGIELVVSETGPLTPETPPSELAALRLTATDRGLRPVGVATGLWFQCNYAAANEALRARAHELTLRLLDQAAAFSPGGSVLVIPAVVGRLTDARPTVAYSDALNRTYDALAALCFEAETRGITLALETVWNRFLLSPVEAAELIDRVNSPAVGMYVDIGNVLAYGYPQDWIATLGRRVARVHAKDYDVNRPGRAGFCGLGEGSVDWPAVLEALRDVDYDGPLTYEGGGDPSTVARRLGNILAGRHPLAENET